METIKIPEEQVVPIDHVARDVYGLRILFVNVFGITHSDNSWTLIDAGVPYSETLIRKWAEKQFGTAPNAILLTHGHFDHVSAASALAEHWKVPIYAHPLEEPYLTGKKEYPAPNFAAGGGVMSLLSPLYPRGPVNLGDRLRLFSESDAGGISIPAIGTWQIIHTPGHTEGHISLFRAEHRLLLAGDAFCTTKPESFFASSVTQTPELHGPPSYFTSDWREARKSVERLAKFEAAIVAPGHGKPVAGPQVPKLLAQLAARFDELAVPENRKSAA